MKKIYIIDDEVAILEAFEALLESEGYIVKTFTNPKQLKIDKKNSPDLILLDVLMSGVDGRDVCRDLKSQPNTKDIPVVMISAHPSASEGINSYGADDFLAKPFDVQDLLDKLEKYTN